MDAMLIFKSSDRAYVEQFVADDPYGECDHANTPHIFCIGSRITVTVTAAVESIQTPVCQSVTSLNCPDESLSRMRLLAHSYTLRQQFTTTLK